MKRWFAREKERRAPALRSRASNLETRRAGALRSAIDAWLARLLPTFFTFLISTVALATILAMALCLVSCSPNSNAPATKAVDPEVSSRGTIEVTAQLVEIPEGAIFKRDLYDYATILKYKVLKVHRGHVDGDVIFVGQYNPFKPRSEAADHRVKDIGGNLKKFEAGQVQRLALEVPIEDHFMGGIVNKYFGRTTGQLYWAVWTNLEKD